MNNNKMTLGVSYSYPPEPHGQTQKLPVVPTNKYNTNVNPSASAETKALHLLRECGFTYIQQLDWFAKNDKGEWIVIEVKEKELFTPGSNFPYYGAGLDKSQLYLRTQLLDKLGFRTYLIIFAKGTEKVYGAYLDELEKKGDFYDTPNGIRIYKISNFEELKWPYN